MSTKARNKVIFLTCLFAFIGLGVALYRQWSDRKPFAVVVFVADGLTPSNVAAARLFAGGSEFRFGMEGMPHLSLASPGAKDYAVADAAAAATSIATGQEVNRGSLSISPAGQPLGTILQAAREAGRSTGLVADTGLADAAAAAFFARGDAGDPAAIALQLLGEGVPDVVLGGGGALLTPQDQGGERRDGRNLLLELRQRGFDIARTKSELESTPGWRAPQLYGVFAEGDLAFVEDQVRYPTQPRLADLVQKAIGLLQFNRKGYLLVVNAGLAGRAARQGQAETLLRQIREIDDAVQTARDYAGENALIVVAGLGNPGGFRLNGFSFAPDRGIAVLGASPSGVQAAAWASGASGQETNGQKIAPPPAQAREPVVEDVLVLVSAPATTQTLPPFIRLTDVHGLIKLSL